MIFDIAIRNGKVIDGTGNPWFRADVGIVREKIISIGKIDAGQARREIDAKDLMVSPGFIDVHSHTDLIFSLNQTDQCRYLEGRIRQGVTTEIIGNCGKSVGPINQENINLLKGSPFLFIWQYVMVWGLSNKIEMKIPSDEFSRFFDAKIKK